MPDEQVKTGYFKRLLLALAGRDATPAAPPAAPAPSDSEAEARLRAEAASLRLDLDDRDRRIEAMKSEHAVLQSEKARVEKEAGEAALVSLFKKMAPPLSSMAAMKAWLSQGKSLDPVELVQLQQELLKLLGKAGLEQVGGTGGSVKFDSALHQRMSGGVVQDGDDVVIQIPGFKVGSRVVQKAMVSAKES